jgi:hypothetical protein
MEEHPILLLLEIKVPAPSLNAASRRILNSKKPRRNRAQKHLLYRLVSPVSKGSSVDPSAEHLGSQSFAFSPSGLLHPTSFLGLQPNEIVLNKKPWNKPPNFGRCRLARLGACQDG